MASLFIGIGGGGAFIYIALKSVAATKEFGEAVTVFRAKSQEAEETVRQSKEERQQTREMLAEARRVLEQMGVTRDLEGQGKK